MLDEAEAKGTGDMRKSKCQKKKEQVNPSQRTNSNKQELYLSQSPIQRRVSKSGEVQRTCLRCRRTAKSARRFRAKQAPSSSYSSRERAMRRSRRTARSSEADTRAAIGSMWVGARIGRPAQSASVPVLWAPWTRVK
jgi:hypothetical protein